MTLLVLTTLEFLTTRLRTGSLSFVSRMLTCTRLISRFFSNAHHHGSLPQQLGVVWDRLLKTDPEGPTLISHAAYPHDWSVHDELLSVCACSTLNPKTSV